jgi:site-specific DNA-methyltransferase (adenine-specific)
MLTEAVSAGYYHAPGWNRDYARIQILTIEELLHGKKVDMPPGYGTFKQAEKAEAQGKQHELGL